MDQFEYLASPSISSGFTLSPTNTNSSKYQQEEEELLLEQDWIMLNEKSPFLSPSSFYSQNNNDSLEQDLPLIQELLNDVQHLEIEDNFEKDADEPLYKNNSLILTPEFLLSLNVFSQNMSWIANQVTFKCIQQSQATSNKIKSLGAIIKNQCKAISSLSYNNYLFEV
ncbi:hypothetical protein CYY_003069 [Polysphondylium violaceum]|uniref:Uncharacterized protein n=1 Tax=Polysphondylium violaceum TaxID=133409 RepID=A0A8J4UUM3_9MYCE|nr:hypothetical protein CYY_003069 [Polysphondylium violaceum]